MGAPSSQRLRSVDVFRGLTVAGMVIVNNPGDWNAVYAPLLHAEWHGWTPTDLIFPFFLFIVGVAVALSPTSAGGMNGVLRRAAVIFGLGLFLAGFPFFNLSTWRVPGVLQRIAFCYLAAVIITRLTRSDDRVRSHLARLAAVAGLLVVGYAVLMLWVPVPGGHAGDLSPAGNLGAWLDRALLKGHLWRSDWDPEGLLSTVPAVATTLLGVMAGVSLRLAADRAAWRRMLIAAGIGLVATGLAWNASFPINKALWTSSYVLFTGGLAAVALAACSAWCDESSSSGWRARTSEPFVALGRNAILLFVLSGLIGRLLVVVMIDPVARVSLKTWIYTNAFAPLAAPRNASLLFAMTNLVLLYALLAWLHGKRWYWRA
jgi:predicted acyltransferase